MKKISILIYSLAGGGAERIVSLLLKEFSKKYNIKFVLMNDTIFFDIPKNVEVVFLEKSNPEENGIKKFLKIPFLGWKYKKFLKENKIEISLSFMNRPNYVNIFAKLFKSKCKTIISERAMPSLQHKNDIQGKMNKFLIKFLYRKANIVIANSKGNRFDLSNNFNLNNTSIKVIYNFTEKKICKEQKKIDKFIYISIGRMDSGKNHELLIKSFNELSLNAELWLIGDGYLRNKLQKIANENVKFLGRQKDVYKFLKQADCFVFSSNYEGFPNVLLEALSCGLPIISTDCKSGPREILSPNTDFKKQTQNIEIAEYGILTPVGDKEKLIEAMKLIYYNDKLRYNYSQKALKRAKDFSVEKILPQWEKVIEGVV